MLVTAPDEATAAALARALVTERLAACVNRLPGVRSTYRWQGELHDEAEVLLIAKTTAAGYPALERRIRELHPYEVPEIVALSIEHGSAPYLAWLAAQVTGDG